jgi:hypothetical protein
MTLPKPLQTTLYVLGALLAVLFVTLIVALVIGARLPRDHSTTVTGTVEATPQRVFAVVTAVADAPKWRSEIVAVQILPDREGRDRWVETLAHNQKMSFLAIRTIPPTADGHALRQVQLNDPSASYGGTWTYKIIPGPSPNQTVLQITEDGFIKPWLYRFAMVHLVGTRSNLENYMHQIQAEAKKS